MRPNNLNNLPQLATVVVKPAYPTANLHNHLIAQDFFKNKLRQNELSCYDSRRLGRCRSGRTGRIRNPLCQQWHLGFKSLSSRHTRKPRIALRFGAFALWAQPALPRRLRIQKRRPPSRSAAFLLSPGQTGAKAYTVRRVSASRYLSAVFCATSAGTAGAGGCLFQPVDSSQSRTNCLSKLGGFWPST